MVFGLRHRRESKIEKFSSCCSVYAELRKNAYPRIIFDDDKTLIMGHRGLISRHLENTLVGLVAGVENGDGVEFDVQLSHDLVPIVFHDRALTRLVGIPDHVDDRSYEELQKLHQTSADYNQRYPIATLHEVLSAMPIGKLINIELKETTILRGDVGMKAVLDVVKPFMGRLSMIISSFDPAILAMVNAHLEIPLGLLVARHGNIEVIFSRAWPTLPYIDAIHPHLDLVNSATSQYLKDLGVKLIFWGHKHIGQEANVVGPRHTALITDILETLREK